MCLQYKFSLEITVLSSCSEGGEKQNKKQNTKQTIPISSCWRGCWEQRYRSASPVEAVLPNTPTAGPGCPAQHTEPVYEATSQTASKQVRASLPACVQLVLGQKLLFQLLIGGQKSAKLGIFFFFEVCFGLREILCGLHMV